MRKTIILAFTIIFFALSFAVSAQNTILIKQTDLTISPDSITFDNSKDYLKIRPLITNKDFILPYEKGVLLNGKEALPYFQFIVPSSSSADTIKKAPIKVNYELDFNEDISQYFGHKLIPLKGDFAYRFDFYCNVINKDEITKIQGELVTSELLQNNKINAIVNYDFSNSNIAKGSVISCYDPIEPKSSAYYNVFGKHAFMSASDAGGNYLDAQNKTISMRFTASKNMTVKRFCGYVGQVTGNPGPAVIGIVKNNASNGRPNLGNIVGDKSNFLVYIDKTFTQSNDNEWHCINSNFNLTNNSIYHYVLVQNSTDANFNSTNKIEIIETYTIKDKVHPDSYKDSNLDSVRCSNYYGLPSCSTSRHITGMVLNLNDGNSWGFPYSGLTFFDSNYPSSFGNNITGQYFTVGNFGISLLNVSAQLHKSGNPTSNAQAEIRDLSNNVLGSCLLRNDTSLKSNGCKLNPPINLQSNTGYYLVIKCPTCTNSNKWQPLAASAAKRTQNINQEQWFVNATFDSDKSYYVDSSNNGVTWNPDYYTDALFELSYDVSNSSDTTSPSISNLINSTTKNNSVTVTWNTNENANETNTLGICPSFTGIFSNKNNTFGTTHLQSIGSLVNLTSYCYKTTACDSSGNCANSNFTFITASNPPQQGTIANEAQGIAAISSAIQNSLVNSYTEINDQLIYARSLSNNQFSGNFDKFVKKGNKAWAFNYVSNGESNVAGTFNLTPSVYVLQLNDLTASQITMQVENLVNSTK